MASELRIRTYEESDFDQVVRVWKDAGNWRPWNDPEHDIGFALRGPHSTLLVGCLADDVVATVMCGEDGHRGWVYYLAVRPDHQGRGYGRDIMAACEAWMAERGIWKCQLLVRQENADALGFYERIGYADTRTRCVQKVLKTIVTSS